MNKRSIFPALIGVAAFLIVIGAGCTKKAADEAAESATERAIEESINSQADVELGTNSIAINTNTSSFQAGGDIELPDGFPTDVYVIDGTIISAITTEENSTYSVTIRSTKSVEQVKSTYAEQLANEGWTISVNASYTDSAAVGAQKGNRSVSITIAADSEQGGTLVAIATSTSNDEYELP